ncbi:hypothetical protein RIF29_40488 [Crotalaria pallida]|uniref:Uncharacterized protein n=1 Tax=Crotalaria pallida TaxID=3830 RepID=A0AAN9HNI1_CROPI
MSSKSGILLMNLLEWETKLNIRQDFHYSSISFFPHPKPKPNPTHTNTLLLASYSHTNSTQRNQLFYFPIFKK